MLGSISLQTYPLDNYLSLREIQREVLKPFSIRYGIMQTWMTMDI